MGNFVVVILISYSSVIVSRNAWSANMRVFNLSSRITLVQMLFLWACFGNDACQHYTEKPLNPRIIEQRLAMPTTDDLRQEAGKLHNPLIRSVDIDLEKGLTPAAAAMIAVAHNPLVRAQQDALPVAHADVIEARILPNPQVTAGVDVPFGPRSAGEAIGYGLGLNWEITSLITRGPRIRAAKAGEEQVRLDLLWKQWQVAEAGKMSLYDVVALREQLSQAQHLAGILEKAAAQAHMALARHDLTAMQASIAESASQDADVSIVETKRDLQDAMLGLNQALGFPPDAHIAVDTTVTLPSQLHPPAEAALLQDLAARRMDLVALRSGYESQDESLRAAIRGQFPKISLGISNTRDYGNFLTLGPALTIDLPIFDRNQGAIASSRASRQQLFDEYVARVFEARTDVVHAVRLIASLNAVIQTQVHEVATLRTLLDDEEKALHQGNLDAATYFLTAVTFSQKQIELIKLRQDLMHTEISLELAAGVVLPLDSQGPVTETNP
jgi:outer membrane protein TolC